MSRNNVLLRVILVVSLATLLFVAAQNLPAGFSSEGLKTHVFIRDVDYGAVDAVEGLDVALVHAGSKNGSKAPWKITLKRDFVTDPSIYLWAQHSTSERTELQDISLVTFTEDGEEIARRTLKFCQPLSWSLEAANPALGGYHESVDLAVQEVSQAE